MHTEWPQPCSTHHEHHPDDGFPVLFFCSLSLASEFVPTKITRVRTEWLQPFSTHHEHHPGDGFPVLFFCSLSLASEFLPKSQECARNGRNHAARIMSIIRVMAFPSSSSAAFHLHLNFFPNHESVRTEWPQPCSTHHEHHPGEGFPVLFLCSLSLGFEFVPRSRECTLNGRNHATRIMNIIGVMAFPSSSSTAFHLQLSFLPKSRHCPLIGRNHTARIMSIIPVTAFPSSPAADFHLQLHFFPNHPSAH